MRSRDSGFPPSAMHELVKMARVKPETNSGRISAKISNKILIEPAEMEVAVVKAVPTDFPLL